MSVSPYITLPAGKLYAAPVGTEPVESDDYYLGHTDGADIEVTPLTEERWAGTSNGLVLDGVFVTGTDTVITVRCIESRDNVMMGGLMADAASDGSVTVLQPRANLLDGGRVALWHIPKVVAGRARELHVRNAIALPNGPIRLKRSATGETLQIVDLRFRVLHATPLPWSLMERKLAPGFLAHCDGANNGTTFVEQMGHAITKIGSPVTSTEHVKFGSAAGKFNGTNAALLCGPYADLGIGTGDFTLDFWFYDTAGATIRSLIYVFSRDTNKGFSVLSGASGLPGRIGFNDGVGGITTDAFALNTWRHVLVSRQRTSPTSALVRLWVDGISITSSAINETDLDLGASTSILIGARIFALGVFGEAYSDFFPGYIDEVRLDVGTARYTGTANFTPPTAPYPW